MTDAESVACFEQNSETLKNCQTKGFYCSSSDEGVNYTVSCSSRGYPVGDTVLFCPDNTLVDELCPAGSYCPTPFEKYECPVGSFCSVGSSETSSCAGGSLACPDTGMQTVNAGAVFLIYFVGFLLIYFTFNLLVQKILNNRQQLVTGAVNHQSGILAKESERDDYKNTLKMMAEKKHQYVVVHRRRGSVVPHNLKSQNNAVQSARARENFIKFMRSPAFKEHVKMLSERSKNLVNHLTGDFQFKKVEKPLTISFNGLNLNLKTGGKPILQNIFGKFQPYNITALMGSSGAGKTTLLSLLRGKAHFATTSGDIFVNKEKVESLVPFSSQMGFVPQDDIMYDDLTVWENLLYSCLLFNKRGYRRLGDCVPMVHYCMELLGLSFIKHSVVGSPEQKGISGGQKKRVSIGMELIKEPSLFFLDEPTSGLDSASSISLMNSLNKIAMSGVNIVCTLHQPRIEIYEILHSLYLLAPGGRVAYHGPAFGLTDHLFRLGYKCPQNSNVSDFVMDVISGFVTPIWKHNENMNVKETIKYICDVSYDQLHPDFEKNLKLQLKGDDRLVKTDKEGDGEATTEKHGGTVGFLGTLRISTSRQLKVYARTLGVYMSVKAVLVMMGLLIGNLFGSVVLSSSGKSELQNQVMSSHLAFIITIQPSLLRLFLDDFLIREREQGAGIDLFPLFVGKVIGNGIDMILCPIFFVGGYYPFIEAQASVFWYLLVFFLLELAVSGLLNLSAVVFGKKNGSTVGSGVIIILWACGGIEPNVSKITENLGGFGELLIGISPFRKSFEAAMLMELTTYSDAFDGAVEKTYSIFRINPSAFDWSLGYLVVYCFVTNILAILAILWKQDNYRYWREVNEAYLSPCYTAWMATRCMKVLMGCANRVLSVFNNLNNKADAWVLSLKKESHEPCEKLYDDLMKETGAIPDAICGICKLRYAEHNHSIQQEESDLDQQDIRRVHCAVEVFKSSNPLLKSQNLRSDERVGDNML